MGEITKLIASITDVVDNTRILQDWLIEETSTIKHEKQMVCDIISQITCKTT